MKLSIALDGFFLARSAEGYSQNTLQTYRYNLRYFLEYLSDVEVEEICTHKLREFFHHLNTEKRTQKVFGGHVKCYPQMVNG